MNDHQFTPCNHQDHSITRRNFLKFFGVTVFSAYYPFNFSKALPFVAYGENKTASYDTGIINLPYQYNALEPYISAQTVQFHYEKHHQGYWAKLNTLLTKDNVTLKTLSELIQTTYEAKGEDGLFNNAAQVYNHNFYWCSMSPQGGHCPQGKLLEAIQKSFGTPEAFIQEISNTALQVFGSGWVWLVNDGTHLKIVTTTNALNPLVYDLQPLFCLDVWEHAYYPDYQNQRKVYIENFFKYLLNWNFAAQNLNC